MVNAHLERKHCSTRKGARVGRHIGCNSKCLIDAAGSAYNNSRTYVQDAHREVGVVPVASFVSKTNIMTNGPCWRQSLTSPIHIRPETFQNQQLLVHFAQPYWVDRSDVALIMAVGSRTWQLEWPLWIMETISITFAAESLKILILNIFHFFSDGVGVELSVSQTA